MHVPLGSPPIEMVEDAGARFEELLGELRAEHAQLRLQLLSAGVLPSLQTAPLQHSGSPAPKCEQLFKKVSLLDEDHAKQGGFLPEEQLPGCVPAGGDDALRSAALDSECSRTSGVVWGALAAPDSGETKPGDDASENMTNTPVVDDPQDMPGCTSMATRSSGLWTSGTIEKARHSIKEMFSVEEGLFPTHETKDASKLQRLVSSPLFELVWSGAIFGNTFVMAAEAQYRGLQMAHELDYDAHGSEGDVWASASSAFEVFNWIFGVLFAIELVIRLAVLKCDMLRDPLSWVDIISVFFWVVERVLPDLVSFNTMMIRVARLVRLARFIRIVRFVNAFQKLYLLVQSIKSSFQALLWSSAVLFLGEFIIALVIQISLSDFLRNGDLSETKREERFQYYGTFTGALLSQFELLLGNWYTITRVLMYNSEAWAMFGVVHQLMLGFAVIEVMTGVLIRETFQVASLDDGIMTAEQRLAVKMNTEKLRTFFLNADVDGNGLLDVDEIREVLERPRVQEWLSAMGLDVDGVCEAFYLLDVDGDGEITVEEFVTGALKLRGPARATEVSKINAKLDEVLRHFKNDSEHLQVS